VLLNIICITLITAPIEIFCDIIMKFLDFVLWTPRTFTVGNVTYCDINFISKYLECWLFCEMGNIYFKKEVSSFFLTALHKLIFTLKMMTRNWRTPKSAVGATTSASFIPVQLSPCITRTEVTYAQLFGYPDKHLRW